MVRYFSRGKEVTWERMAEILDRREAALRGTCAWVLLGKKIGGPMAWSPSVALGLVNVVKITGFLRSDRYEGGSDGTPTTFPETSW